MALSRLATAALVLLFIAVVAAADEPYKRMLDDKLVFTGTESLSDAGKSRDAIVIGLFSPDDDDHPVGRALTRGVTLAVDQVNAAGGIEGRPIRLVRRWADDPWGAGANEVVKLVFEDQAWALIGGPDGASTHIAQQVASKAHIPLVSPVSSDPSLTHTRVPWIFRLPTDDTRQSTILAEEGVTRLDLKRVGLITSTDHDGRTAATELVTALQRSGLPPAFHLEVALGEATSDGIADRIAAFEPDGLVLRVPPADVRLLAEALRAVGLDIPLILPWIPGLDLRRFPLPYAGKVVSLVPFGSRRSCGVFLKMERAFITRYGDRPTPAAVFSYDAARLVIEAASAGASGRMEIRTGIAAVTDFDGASGPIIWDRGGGNHSATPHLVSY